MKHKSATKPSRIKEVFISRSEGETMALAARLWRRVLRENIRLFLLKGPLGSGKTAFARGLAKAAGVRRPVKSPSFVLAQEYPFSFPLPQGRGQGEGHSARQGVFVHADLYRLAPGAPVEDLILEGDPFRVTAIEWADRLHAVFARKTPAMLLSFSKGRAPNVRRITLRINDE